MYTWLGCNRKSSEAIWNAGALQRTDKDRLPGDILFLVAVFPPLVSNTRRASFFSISFDLNLKKLGSAMSYRFIPPMSASGNSWCCKPAAGTFLVSRKVGDELIADLGRTKGNQDHGRPDCVERLVNINFCCRIACVNRSLSQDTR